MELQGIQGATNKNWKRNLGMTCALTAALGYYVFRVSVRNEERYILPTSCLYAPHASSLLICNECAVHELWLHASELAF